MKGFPPKPDQVRHVAPRLIYQRWERMRAFEPILATASPATLHALRIEGKRLRYTLEFFSEVLGQDAKPMIEQMVQLQDYLGALHDADIANYVLHDFLFPAQGDLPVIAPGVAAYMACKQRELQTLLAGFPQVWEAFNRLEARQWLANAIAAL